MATSNPSFSNKTVIVTGCSSGIGLATALLFLSRSANVFGIDISPFNHTPAPPSSNFTFHRADLTAPDAIPAAITACKAAFGPRIDVLCNIAGIMDSFASADSLQDSEWERVMAINLTVPVKLMREVVVGMKEQEGGGAIVNVGSYSSHSGATAGIAYTASKHGIVGATKNVAWRFHREGVRCNAVLPGGVVTNITSSAPPESWDHAAYAISKPIHDVHQSYKREDLVYGSIGVDDVAHGIVFLASDEAKMINGTLMPIDNAWSSI